MKNRYFILSMLFWVLASVCMAVTLPRTSYQSSLIGGEAPSEGIVLGTGTSYKQIYLTSSENWGNACWEESEGNERDCEDCCIKKLNACTSGNCLDQHVECVNVCHNGPSLPLGSSLLLLPFIAIYAVIRKRKETVMA